jgi:hypothetical protein
MVTLPDPLAADAIDNYLAFLGSLDLWGAVLALVLLSLLPSCALVLCAHRIATGQALPAAGGLPAALRCYPGALVISVVFLAVVEAASMLFLIPGIYLGGALQLWIVALVAGDAKAFQSLQSSWRLVLGRWWRSNTMVAVVAISGMGAGVAAGLIGGIVVHGLSAAAQLASPTQRIVDLIPWILGVLIAAPAYPVALVASYRDLGAPAR